MTDLRERFRSLDRLPAPDLWREIETRSVAVAPSASRGYPLLLLAALAALLMLGAGAVAIGAGLISWPSAVRNTDPLPDIAWDGALRVEPSSGADNVRFGQRADGGLPPGEELGRWLWLGDSREQSLDDTAWIDIAGLWTAAGLGQGAWPLDVRFELGGSFVSSGTPTGYGFVLDINEDGEPDLMFGMDNEPDPGGKHHREWIADLRRGEVSINDSRDSFGHFAFDTFADTIYPGESNSPPHIVFSRERMAGREVVRFYVWAATVVDGVLVVDHAPDRGWLTKGVICRPVPTGPVLDLDPCPVPYPTPRP